MDHRGERMLKLQEEGGGDKIVLSDIEIPFVVLVCNTAVRHILFGYFPVHCAFNGFLQYEMGIASHRRIRRRLLHPSVLQYHSHVQYRRGTTTIIIFASMVFAPFFGRLVDRFGKRATVMVGGSILMIPAFLTMAFTMIPPVVPMIVLGAAFVMVPAAMWPSIPLIVEKNRVSAQLLV